MQDELPPDSELQRVSPSRLPPPRRPARRRIRTQLVDELAARFHRLRSTLIEPYPDALGALDRLAETSQLGFITNGNADVEVTPFAGRFAFRLHARRHGPSKPDVGMFVQALARSGVPAHAAVHVGDSLDCDVAGAQAAGFHAVWLNRDGALNETRDPARRRDRVAATSSTRWSTGWCRSGAERADIVQARHGGRGPRTLRA